MSDVNLQAVPLKISNKSSCATKIPIPITNFRNGLGLQQNGGNTGANVVVNNAASAPHRTDLQVPEVIVLDKNSPVKFLSYVKTGGNCIV